MKPPVGYDYKAPPGYKAAENPTFPKTLYEAAEEILVITPTSTHIPNQPGTYIPPKKLKPKDSYVTPEKNHKPKDAYVPPDKSYKPKDAYVPPEKKLNYDVNPTFPKSFYEAIQAKDYQPPTGYDYQTPKGYSPDQNPTFPANIYEAPHVAPRHHSEAKIPDSGYKAPVGYDYPSPKGYDPAKNPTFPEKLYQAPPKDHHPKTPSDGYLAPKGYDYSAPDGYDPAKNPTFPKRKYFPPTLAPSYQPPAAKEQRHNEGYLPPEGYDYKPPKGYKADDNPTFPKALYEEPTTEYLPPHEHKEAVHPKAFYEEPTKDYHAPEDHKDVTHPKKHEISSLYDIPAPHDSHEHVQDGYKYHPPKGYSASENPTFPKKHQSNKKPALNTGYQAPQIHTTEQPPSSDYLPPSTEDYLPPSITKLPNNYPKHQFNIIIKNKNKPDTSISITPEPPVVSVSHGHHKV